HWMYEFGNPQVLLFRRPTGLAVGLALKEPAPPPDSPADSPHGNLGPPLRGFGLGPRIRRGAEYTCRRRDAITYGRRTQVRLAPGRATAPGDERRRRASPG